MKKQTQNTLYFAGKVVFFLLSLLSWRSLVASVIVEEKQMSSTNFSIEKQKKEELLLELYKSVSSWDENPKSIVVVMGNTKTGKSTTICHMINANLEERKEEYSTEDESASETEDVQENAPLALAGKVNYPTPTIGHNDTKSEMLFPTIYWNPNDQHPMYYCDMPSFYAQGYSIHKYMAEIAPWVVYHSVHKIKAIVLVIPHNDLNGKAGRNFDELITKTMSYFSEDAWEDIKNNIFIAVTKYGKGKSVNKFLKERYTSSIQELQDSFDEKIEDEKMAKIHAQNTFRFLSSFIYTEDNKIHIVPNKIFIIKPLGKKAAATKLKMETALHNSCSIQKKHFAVIKDSPMLADQIKSLVIRMSSYLSKHKKLIESIKILAKELAVQKNNVQQTKTVIDKQQAILRQKIEKAQKDNNTILLHEMSYKPTTVTNKITNTIVLSTVATGIVLVAGPIGLTIGGAILGANIKNTIFWKTRNLTYYTQELVEYIGIKYSKGYLSLTVFDDKEEVFNKNYGYAELKECKFNWQRKHEKPIESYRSLLKYEFEYRGNNDEEGEVDIKFYIRKNKSNTTRNDIKNWRSELAIIEINRQTPIERIAQIKQKIAQKEIEIKKINTAILNTYDNSKEKRDIAYNKMKLDMLKHFSKNILFKSPNNLAKNEENLQKSMAPAYKQEAEECIQMWIAWLDMQNTQLSSY